MGLQIAQSRTCLYTLGPEVGILDVLGSQGVEAHRVPERNTKQSLQPKKSGLGARPTAQEIVEGLPCRFDTLPAPPRALF